MLKGITVGNRAVGKADLSRSLEECTLEKRILVFTSVDARETFLNLSNKYTICSLTSGVLKSDSAESLASFVEVSWGRANEVWCQ